MLKKKSSKFWLSLALFGLIGQIAWVVENMYFNVFIYNMFGASPTEISVMVSASSVVATLTTLFIGALSDKIGKRKIFISAGYILWGVSILGFALVREDIISAVFPTLTSVSALCIAITVALDCVMTFFGSSANDAAFNAWLTDAAEPKKRGMAEGVNSMMPLVAILAVFGGFMSFDLSESRAWCTIFIIIGCIVVLVGIASIFLLDEGERTVKSEEPYFKTILFSFRPSTVKNNPLLYLTVISFALFGISIQVFMPYLIIYYEVSLELENYVFVMAPAIILASIVTALFGKCYDKLGFIHSLIPTLISLALGYLFLFSFTNTVLVFIGSLLMMTGYLTGMAVFGAMLRDKIPANRAGAFQGIRIVGQVLIPGIIGPMIGAWVLSDAEVMINSDGTESFIPSRVIFLAALLVLVLVIISVSVIARVLKREKIKNS